MSCSLNYCNNRTVTNEPFPFEGQPCIGLLFPTNFSYFSWLRLVSKHKKRTLSGFPVKEENKGMSGHNRLVSEGNIVTLPEPLNVVYCFFSFLVVRFMITRGIGKTLHVTANHTYICDIV